MTKRHEFSFLGRKLSFDPEAVLPRAETSNAAYINSMAFDVSGNCNLRCAYCAESATLPARDKMPGELIDCALCRLFRWSPPGAAVSIHLGSGEPLLQTESVLEIGLKANALATVETRPLSLHLTTNGTMLNDSIVQDLIDGGWNIKVSIDGPEAVHDLYRRDKSGRGTYKKIESHVRYMAMQIPERFSTTSVLCRSVDPAQVFYDIASLGVRRIELVPVAVPGSSPLSLTSEDMLAYRDFITDYAKRLAAGEDLPIHIRFHKRLQRVLGYNNACIPCGAGRNFLAAGPDGILYPCFRFVGLEKYSLGDLNSGPVEESVHDFMQGSGRPYAERRICSDCWAGPVCGGPCFACSELLWNQDPSPDYCSMVKSEGEAAIWLASVLREEDPRRLLEMIGVTLGGM
jgi:uncharacterized protein